MKKILFLTMLFCTMPCLVFASEIILNSGEKIDGKIVEQTDKYVKMDPGIGMAMTYYMDQIDTIDGQKSVVKSPKKPVINDQEPVKPAAVVVPWPTVSQKLVKDIQPTPLTTATVLPPANQGAVVIINKATIVPIQTNPMVPAINIKGMDRRTLIKSLIFSGISGFFIVIFTLVFLVLYFFPAICLQFISKKIQRGTPWMAWVPIANLFLMCKIADVRYSWLWLLFLGIIPIVGIIVVFGLFGYIWYKIALALNKPGWWGILAVLPVVSIVAMGYLAFAE